MSGSSDFGCNGVKAGTKHNEIEEKSEVIEGQVGLNKEEEVDEITLSVFGENANFKDPSIEVDTDYPSKYKEKMMPILDIKMDMEVVQCQHLCACHIIIYINNSLK